MSQWEDLVNELATDTPPLDETAKARITARAKGAIPRRRRRWLILALAAVLALSACGYAVATGQFSQWFWNLTPDAPTPEAAEDLLASLGTVIGQSQTADGVTLTLEGALWDGNYIALSLSMAGEDLPQYGGNTQSSDCWLAPANQEAYLREMAPEWSEAELQDYLESLRAFSELLITHIYRRETETHHLEITRPLQANEQTTADLTLHLENLDIAGKTLAGPFTFDFTVEPRDLRKTYTGDVTLTPAAGPPLRITQVDISPFRAEVFFETLEPSEEALFDTAKLSTLRIKGEERSPSGRHGLHQTELPDGRAAASTYTQHFRTVINPADVEAVCIGGAWLELSALALQAD